jgi:hypothetical protein
VKQRLVGRMPTHLGAVIIAVLGLFVGILLAQLTVRIAGISGGVALLLELVVLCGWFAWVWVSLPDRYFTPFTGFYSGDEIEPWVEPQDRDDGRMTPEELARRDRLTRESDDPPTRGG